MMSPQEIVEYLEQHFDVDIERGEIRRLRKTPQARGYRKSDGGRRAGYTNNAGYRVIQIQGKNYYEHRLIWLYAHGGWPTNIIDHINRCKSDNRLANLRDTSPSVNGTNKHPDSNRVPGVSVDRRHRKFIAYISVDGKRRYLGYFKSYGAACRARITAEVEMGVSWEKAA